MCLVGLWPCSDADYCISDERWQPLMKRWYLQGGMYNLLGTVFRHTKPCLPCYHRGLPYRSKHSLFLLGRSPQHLAQQHVRSPRLLTYFHESNRKILVPQRSSSKSFEDWRDEYGVGFAPLFTQIPQATISSNPLGLQTPLD